MSAGTADKRDEPSEYAQGHEDGVNETERALGYDLCPYAYGLGTCSMGCRDEPACWTSPGEYHDAIADLIRRAVKAATTS